MRKIIIIALVILFLLTALIVLSSIKSPSLTINLNKLSQGEVNEAVRIGKDASLPWTISLTDAIPIGGQPPDDSWRENDALFLDIVNPKVGKNFRFNKPVTLTFNFYSDPHADLSKLKIFRTPSETAPWEPLETKLDLKKQIATASSYNIGYFITAAPLLCPEDKSEPNDDPLRGRIIGEVNAPYYDGPGTPPRIKGTSFGSPLTGILDSKTDEDWFIFEAHQGKSYKIGLNNSNNLDTTGTIQWLDDVIATVSGELTWTPDQSIFHGDNYTTFSLGVKPKGNSQTGCKAKFTLTVEEL